MSEIKHLKKKIVYLWYLSILMFLSLLNKVVLDQGSKRMSMDLNHLIVWPAQRPLLPFI